MTNGSTSWIMALPVCDPFARQLLRQLAKPGRHLVPGGDPERFSASGLPASPILAVVDLSLPEAPEWLDRLKFGGLRAGGRPWPTDTGGLALTVLGLSPQRQGDSARLDPGLGIRVRADHELREPYSSDDIVQTAERLALARVGRPGLRTLALEYVPSLERQEEMSRLVDRLLELCGLPEMPRFMFGCGVTEALDNARLHGSRPGEPSDKARVWFEADAGRVSVAVSDNGAGVDEAHFADSGESPLATARRRNAAGRPGGLGLHMMRRSADEVHYEPQRKRVLLVKGL